MYNLEKILTEENLNKFGAASIVRDLIPPLREIQQRTAELVEELRVAKIRNEEQAKVIDAIVKSLRV